MPRTIPEWIGKTDDSPIPNRVRLRVFLRFGGICQCGCNTAIRTGQKWQCDHKLALVNGGAHSEANLWPMLVEHHRNKTQTDVAAKALTYRKRKAHLGLKRARKPLPGSRASGWKKKMDGTVVRR